MPVSDMPLPRLLSILKGSDLFQDLTPSEMDALIIHMRMIRAQKGYEIIRQGDSWDSFYVLLSGKVSVKVRKGLKTKALGVLGPGDFFGEMALLSLQPRNATITAEAVSELMVLNKTEFDNILMKHPVRGLKVRRAYLDRRTNNKN